MPKKREKPGAFGFLRDVKGPFWPAIILGLGTLIRLPQIYEGLGSLYLFRQAQTAFAAREFAREGLSAGPGPIYVYGEGSQIPFEMPVFQVLAALLSQTGLSIEVSGRVLALLFFQTTAVFLFLILRAKFGANVALVFLLLSQALPFGIIWSTAFMIEFPATAAGFGAVFFFLRFIAGTHRFASYTLSVVLAMITGVIKGTTLVPILAFLGVIVATELWKASEASQRLRLGISGAGLAISSLGAGFAWTSFADSVKASNPLTAWLTSANLQTWNYGTVEQRLTIANWEKILYWAEPIVLAPLLLLVIVLIALSKIMSTEERSFSLALVVSGISGPAVFWNLYIVHSYYLSAIYFQLVALISIVAVRTIDGFRQEHNWTAARLTGIALVVFVIATFQTAQAQQELRSVYSERPLTPFSQEIIELVPTGQKILLFHCDWDPTIAYETDRPVMMFRNPADPRNLEFEEIQEILGVDLETYSFAIDCAGFDEWGGQNEASWINPISTYVAQIRDPEESGSSVSP